MRRIDSASAVAAALLLWGCASDTSQIPGQYVSPLAYQEYNCRQLGMELQRVTRRATELGGHIDQTASNDDMQTAIGLVLFWPALFFLEGGDGPEAAEYARLKGEREALEAVAVQKECGIEVMPAGAPAPPAEQGTEGESL